MNYYLREISKNDVAVLNAWRADRNLIDSLGSTFRYVDKAVDEKWFEAYQSSRANAVRLAICETISDAIIGAIYLLHIDWHNRSVEFSIWIGEKLHQGKGAGLQASKLALDHAFSDLNLHRVYLTVLTSNLRAIGLYKKLGFQQEGILRGAVYKNGSYHDMLQMSILDSEYFKTTDIPAVR
jgi:diamine N-acetyltransferase